MIAVLLLLALAGGGCRSVAGPPLPRAGEAMVADRLFFGRAIPAGGVVSDAELEKFVDEVVTPRFPEGLTIWQGRGQWRDSAGLVVREEMFAIEVFHGGSATEEEAVSAIALEYKRRFGQEAVLRSTAAARVRFY